MPRRFLIIGAHPDDADIRFGGTAAKLVKAGHHVKFVSMANGNCGHYAMSGQELAQRRYLETQASKAVSGIDEYQVLMQNNDCELMPTLENRKEVIRIIRNYAPDVVLSHRLCDYHADHRAAAQLVLDAAYLVQVPMFVKDAPIMKQEPVFGYLYDAFTDPRPLSPDAAVPIDDVMDIKCRMLDCHVSQVYEWLAMEHGHLDKNFKGMTWEEKRAYLTEVFGARFVRAANEARATLRDMYGASADSVVHAEVFEYSPYGRKVSLKEFQDLFRPELP